MRLGGLHTVARSTHVAAAAVAAAARSLISRGRRTVAAIPPPASSVTAASRHSCKNSYRSKCKMRRPEELRTAAVVSLAVLLTMASVHSAHAKRGCSAFGHSCFGGHGKRMDPGAGSAPEEVMYPGLRDVVFTAPRSDGLLDALRRQQHELGQEDLPPQAQVPQVRPLERDFNLQPFLRQWLQAYRSSQEVRQNNM